MRICVWKTGHEIADRVADALKEGFDAEVYKTNVDEVDEEAINIAYGILRGTSRVFKGEWFHLDNGFFNPGHFHGNYRISYKGTQAKWHDGIPQKEWDGELEGWKEPKNILDDGIRRLVTEGFCLICPPTEAVCGFFGINSIKWFEEALRVSSRSGKDWIVRHKGEEKPIDWEVIDCVITFNSSVGWQALQRGIPVISDPEHSIIGSYYRHVLQKDIDFLSDEYKRVDRALLFRAMAAHQFTLKEIAEGQAWNLIQHYLKKN